MYTLWWKDNDGEKHNTYIYDFNFGDVKSFNNSILISSSQSDNILLRLPNALRLINVELGNYKNIPTYYEHGKETVYCDSLKTQVVERFGGDFWIANTEVPYCKYFSGDEVSISKSGSLVAQLVSDSLKIYDVAKGVFSRSLSIKNKFNVSHIEFIENEHKILLSYGMTLVEWELDTDNAKRCSFSIPVLTETHISFLNNKDTLLIYQPKADRSSYNKTGIWLYDFKNCQLKYIPSDSWPEEPTTIKLPTPSNRTPNGRYQYDRVRSGGLGFFIIDSHTGEKLYYIKTNWHDVAPVFSHNSSMFCFLDDDQLKVCRCSDGMLLFSTPWDYRGALCFDETDSMIASTGNNIIMRVNILPYKEEVVNIKKYLRNLSEDEKMVFHLE